MKPIIGIITRPERSTEKNKTMAVYEEIRQAIIKSGGIPLGIMPLNYDLEDFDTQMFQIIDKCHGVIFQGGETFTKYEIECMKYVYEKDIPTLGICLGMQLMGYLFGGELISTRTNEHKQKDCRYVHDVFIKNNSKLYEIFKVHSIKVNSRHKHTVINTSLEISAVSSDGLIEGIEDKNKKFFVGVQWHPESMTSYDILESKLFNYFIDVSRK